MTKKSLVKKPSKKDRLLAKRAARAEMLKVDMDIPVTLECPECKVQQVMTLDEYFDKIGGPDSPFKKLIKCGLCPGHPLLVFYKVNRAKIAAAGFNWERKRQGISEEEMLDKLDTYDKVKGLGKQKLHPDKVLLE
jgi:hypothetical protein